MIQNRFSLLKSKLRCYFIKKLFRSIYRILKTYDTFIKKLVKEKNSQQTATLIFLNTKKIEKDLENSQKDLVDRLTIIEAQNY